MKRIIALTLCLVLCMGLCVNVFAANENNTKGVVFSVELDKPNLTVSDEDQTVRMTFTANKEFETCSVSYTASTDEFPVTALKGGANMPAATVNPVTKMLSWNSNDGNVVKMQEFGIVDVKIPANTPAGTYELGFSKLKLSENYGADIWESTATAYATLTIAPAPVAVSNITLNKNTLALTVGGSETLTATVYPENATNKDVTWSSDNENAATVDANGTVTAVGEGEAIITATTEDGKYTATCTVKVSPAPVAANGVTLTPDKTTLNVGEKQTLTATVLPAYATNKNVTWVSSDTSVATVENGVVTAVGKGTATITVTTEDGGYTATCEVTVKLPVSAVTLNETSTALVVGNTKQLTATVVPANADDSTVTWKSGNTNVATVDQTGKVTAVGVGTTTITATAGGKSATCTVTVTAKPVPIEAIALRDAAVSVGGTIQLEPVFTPGRHHAARCRLDEL